MDWEERMGDVERIVTDVHPGGVSRRLILKATGGAVLVAGAAMRRGSSTSAQEASPVASPEADGSLLGQQVVIRIRTVKADHEVDDVLAQIQEGFVPLAAEIPGLVLYLAAANPETRALFSIGVFADAAGVAASNRVAGEWVKANMPDIYEGDPAVHDGVIGVATTAPTGDLLGKHVVIRLREPNPDWDVDEMMRLIGEGYVSLVEALPGFVAYLGSSDAETGGQAYITIFDDKAGTKESTRVAGEWLKANDYTFFTGDPTLAEGEIGAAAVAMK
jgi:hypothetical protein